MGREAESGDGLSAGYSCFQIFWIFLGIIQVCTFSCSFLLCFYFRQRSCFVGTVLMFKCNNIVWCFWKISARNGVIASLPSGQQLGGTQRDVRDGMGNKATDILPCHWKVMKIKSAFRIYNLSSGLMNQKQGNIELTYFSVAWIQKSCENKDICWLEYTSQLHEM